MHWMGLTSASPDVSSLVLDMSSRQVGLAVCCHQQTLVVRCLPTILYAGCVTEAMPIELH